MQGTACVVALDAGVGGGRSVVCDATGHILGSAYREWTYRYPPTIPGAVEFDADAFWAALCATTREAVRRAGIAPEAVCAISATSMREGFVLIGTDGQALYAGPNLDQRGAAENRSLAAAHGERIYHLSGHWPSTLHAPGRLLWFQAHAPEVLERTAFLLMIDDWIRYRLSGVAATEPSSACASLLFDTRKQTWSADLCRMLSVRTDILPPVGAAGDVIGTLTSASAVETGLLSGTPVVLGGGDGQCGLIGLGAVMPAAAGAIAGTTTPMLVVVDHPYLDPEKRTWTRCHALRALWAVEANAGVTGLSYRWLRDLLWTGAQEATSAPTAFSDMDDVARAAPIGSNGIRVYLGANTMDARRPELVMPYGSISGIPIADAPTGARASILRATLESIAFAMRYNWGLLREVTGQTPPVLRLGGGQARSVLWRQILADVLGVPILVGSADETTAVGAAICAWVGAGRYANVTSASQEVVRHVTVEPQDNAHQQYDDHYHTWLEGLPRSTGAS